MPKRLPSSLNKGHWLPAGTLLLTRGCTLEKYLQEASTNWLVELLPAYVPVFVVLFWITRLPCVLTVESLNIFIGKDSQVTSENVEKVFCAWSTACF